MKRRTTTRYEEPNAFDESSYTIVVGLLDAAEDYLVESGKCPANEASNWLTRDYLKCEVGIINGATCYVFGDEYLAASIFLSHLPGAKSALKLTRRANACAKMLAEQPHLFFPEYGTMLRHFFNIELTRTFPMSLRINGLAVLASAKLPGARAEVRRENRRRSGSEGLIVTDSDMKLRMIPKTDFDSLLFYAKQLLDDKTENSN